METVDRISELIDARAPSYLVTANTNYAMLTARSAELRAFNARAAMVLADGAPLVWASRWRGTSVPERVAGSDLIFALCERAAERGHRIYLLGGADGVAEEAARRLSERYPGLTIAGTEAPPHRELTAEEDQALVDRVRAARPDLLFIAFGQPKGELWLTDRISRLGVPVSIQVGASLDFAAGRVSRAPVRLQKLGLEWAYRMWLEPARLGPRYARNAVFVLGRIAADFCWIVSGGRSLSRGANAPASAAPIAVDRPAAPFARTVR
jgi:N-acetylglucosaminyldiphosphoundecaprenol N-acetyl-beta-D-mannosaminyltransferase